MTSAFRMAPPPSIPSGSNLRKQENGDYLVFDKEGTQIARMPVGATFFDQTCFPYLEGYPETYENLDWAMGKVLWSALVHSPWDHSGEKDFYPAAEREDV